MDNYGFIREKLDIKVLILFILKRLPAPVSQNLLTELTMIDNATNYFDYIECLSELERSGHILFSDDKYIITPKGVRNGTEMEDHVPYTVRTKALAGIERASKILERESLIRTSQEEKPEGGLYVSLSLSDRLENCCMWIFWLQIRSRRARWNAASEKKRNRCICASPPCSQRISSFLDDAKWGL